MCATRLSSDGTWMIVEPIAGDDVAANLNPVGRIYYSASTVICVPASLSQEVGAGLGAQAGEKKIGEAVSCRRIQALPPRDRDSVQHGLRGEALVGKLAENFAQSAKIEIEIIKEPGPNLAGLFCLSGTPKALSH